MAVASFLGQGVQHFGLPDDVVLDKIEVEGRQGIVFKEQKSGEVIGGPFSTTGHAKEWLLDNGYRRGENPEQLQFHRETPAVPNPRKKKA